MNATTDQGREQGAADRVRELVADIRCRIQLDDYVAEITTAAIGALHDERFSTDPQRFEEATVQHRLEDYQTALQDAVTAAVLIARWGERANLPTLQGILRQLGDYASGNGGIVQWAALRWMPCLTVLYAAGISALLGGRAEILADLFTVRRGRRHPAHESSIVASHAIDSARHSWGDACKLLAAYRNHRVAFSNYMFDQLQPILDGLLHAGLAYEEAFDRFEILSALTYASGQEGHTGFWGPPGRFAAHCWGGASLAYEDLQREAAAQGNAWPISAAGLFSGSHEAFLEAAKRYREECMNNLHWY